MFRSPADAAFESASPLVAVDLRATLRYACPVPVPVRGTVKPGFGGQPFRIRDISATGVGLLTWFLPPPGAAIALPWHFGPPAWWRTVVVRALRRDLKPDGWVLGCAFDVPLTALELHAFLDLTGAAPLAPG